MTSVSEPVEAPEPLVNFRDLGGLPARTGAVRPGVLCRSEALAVLSAEQFATLGERVGEVVDLRSEAEVAAAPTPAGAGDPHIVNLPLLEGAVRSMLTLPPLGALYDSLLDAHGATFVRIARTVAGADTATLVHCTAGKDRTGVAIALLLDASGVDRDAVVDDYALTERRLSGAWSERILARLASAGIEVTDELTTLATRSPAPVMRAMLARLDAEFGGAAGYLRMQGLDDDTAALLRTRLIAA